VQMRVMSIASVHRALYSGASSGQVRADELLNSVIASTISAGLTDDRLISIHQSYAPAMLYPDQAVPLLLMASEAVTNALKYMGRLENGDATLDICLTVSAEGKALLRIVNTCGTPFLPREQVMGSGLGRSLIAGFATQIGGVVETLVTDDYYDFRLSFEAASFDPQAQDADVEDVEG
jgi:Signal transduction histidine kinase